MNILDILTTKQIDNRLNFIFRGKFVYAAESCKQSERRSREPVFTLDVTALGYWKL